MGELAIGVLFEVKKQGGQEQHIDENIAQEPKMSHVWIVAQGVAIIGLKDVHVQRCNRYDSKEERQKNPNGAFTDQLNPISFAYGKVNSHARYIKEQGNPPDVQQGHGYPQAFHQVVAAHKANEHGPGLKYNSDVIDQ